MIPKIIHWVWIGKSPFPEMMIRAHESFNGMQDLPVWEKMVWTEDLVHDLGLSPEDFAHQTHAGSSNIIRLHALYKYGGIYMDADVKVMKDPSPLLQHDEFIARQPDGVFCNSVMGAKPGSPWIKRQIELLADFRLHDAAHACHIIEQVPSENLTVLPTHYFYPWGHDEKPNRSKITDETYCVHHWEGSWLK